MNATLSFLHAPQWASEELVDESVRPTRVDRLLRERLPFGKRVSRAVSRFLITFCIGVAATLAWQSHGDAIRVQIPVHRGQSFRRIADSVPMIADSF